MRGRHQTEPVIPDPGGAWQLGNLAEQVKSAAKVARKSGPGSHFDFLVAATPTLRETLKVGCHGESSRWCYSRWSWSVRANGAQGRQLVLLIEPTGS